MPIYVENKIMVIISLKRDDLLILWRFGASELSNRLLLNMWVSEMYTDVIEIYV
jgi:hypothetical protein